MGPSGIRSGHIGLLAIAAVVLILLFSLYRE